MSLNCIEIETLTALVPQTGVIKRFFQENSYSLVIQYAHIDADFALYFSIRDNYNHLCLLPRSPVKGKSGRFADLLNARLIGSRIRRIFQADYSRIVVVELESQGIKNFLACRMWNTGANILWLDADNTIQDCLRRMPRREEWPGETFVFPGKKTTPSTVIFKIRPEFQGGSLHQTVYQYYHDLITQYDIAQKKKELSGYLEHEIIEVNKKLEVIGRNLRENRENEALRNGELLKNHLYQLKKGLSVVELFDEAENQSVIIPLVASLTPAANAARYFDKYKKIKNGRKRWEDEQDKAQKKNEELTTLLAMVQTQSDLKKITHLAEKVRKLSKPARIKSGSGEKSLPGRQFNLTGGYKAFVSKSDRDAEALLKNVATGNDYWFHVRDCPGSHVIVKQFKGKEPGEETIREAATLAVYYSKERNAVKADIFFTRVKYLHKPKNGPHGLVFPTQEKNITVRFDEVILKKIFITTQV